MSPSAFLGREKVAGMPADIGRPSSLEGPPGKVDQAAANYGDSTEKCNSCQHFDGVNACSKVDGEIDPEGHSRYYERGDGDVTNEDESGSEEPDYGRPVL